MGSEAHMERGLLLSGRYRLEEELGHGGMSVVWRAHDDVLGRKVAVKVVAPKLAGDTSLLDRIRAEARAAACMCHPYIVNVHDYGEASFGEDPPLPFVVMEIVEGPSLRDVLKHGPLEWRAGVRTCAEVASALAVAHARGIVHRDVTPGNVMLTPSGAKLVDFGISATVGEADIGPGGMLLGTPAYLAPERLDGGSVQPATDVYALGLLLYKSLTGHLPWQSTTTAQMLAAHRYVEPAPLPHVPGLPERVADLCRRCLAKRPEDRPTSAEVAAVLSPACIDLEAVGLHRSWIGRARVPSASRALMSRAFGTAFGTAFGAATRTSSAVRPRWHGRWSPSLRRPAAAAATAVGLLLLAAASSSLADPGAGARPPEQASPAAGQDASPVRCQVRYELRRDWGSGASVGLTVTNVGEAALQGWQLDFAFPGDQRVVRGSPGSWQQAGRSVAVVDPTGAALPPGRSAEFGFEAAYQGENPLPTGFRVNGSDCAPELVTVAGSGAGTPEGGSASGHGGGGPGKDRDGDDKDGRGGKGGG